MGWHENRNRRIPSRCRVERELEFEERKMLTNSQAIELKKARRAGFSISKLARKFDISIPATKEICRGKSHSMVKMEWPIDRVMEWEERYGKNFEVSIQKFVDSLGM